MKYSTRVIGILTRLRDGEHIGEGELSSQQLRSLVKELESKNAISFSRKGRLRGFYVAPNKERFLEACSQLDPSLKDLDAARMLAEGEVNSRKMKVDLFGNSKQGGEDRTLKGFTLLSSQPIEVRYLGFDYPIGPLAGLHVVARSSLSIPDAVTIIIVENAECLYNSSWIKNVGLKESDGPFILMYRSHITEEGKRWLESIPNRILYFGDFDLGGVRVYETEYKRRLGDRISFILPEDLEQRIRRNGNPELYTKQVNEGFAKLISPSGELTVLIELLHRLQSTYEQEGYCSAI